MLNSRTRCFFRRRRFGADAAVVPCCPPTLVHFYLASVRGSNCIRHDMLQAPDLLSLVGAWVIEVNHMFRLALGASGVFNIMVIRHDMSQTSSKWLVSC